MKEPKFFSELAAEGKPSSAGADDHPRILVELSGEPRKLRKLIGRLGKRLLWNVTAFLPEQADLEDIALLGLASCSGITLAPAGESLLQLMQRHDVVVARAASFTVQQALAARCPMIAWPVPAPRQAKHFSAILSANAGAIARKLREVVGWLDRAFRDDGRLVRLWKANLETLAPRERELSESSSSSSADEMAPSSGPELRALPTPVPPVVSMSLPRRWTPAKKLLLCDLHTHTTWSDGKLSVAELVDFYGQRGFDCLCITDHLCDPKSLLGKLVNLTGLVILPEELDAYFCEIEREKERAWNQYELLLMAGVEFNKDGYTAKTSTHLLGIDLQAPIDPSLGLKATIAEIQAQGGLAIASHPHEVKGAWGKNTLYLWEHLDEYAPLLDAWEVANRDDIFNPVGLKKLPFVANSDFHKPKHIHSWKTLLHCEKNAEAIKQCIRVNRDVSITLFREMALSTAGGAQPWLSRGDEVEAAAPLAAVQA